MVSTISAEKSHKHGDNKKLLKSGGHEHQLKESGGHKLEHAAKSASALPLHEEGTAAEQKPAREGRKHHRHGKNKKGGQQNGEQQTGRSRKAHAKSKANPNGPTKSHHNKHSRKQGRGKQAQQQ